MHLQHPTSHSSSSVGNFHEFDQRQRLYRLMNNPRRLELQPKQPDQMTIEIERNTHGYEHIMD